MKKKLLKKLMVLALSAVTAFSAVPAAMVHLRHKRRNARFNGLRRVHTCLRQQDRTQRLTRRNTGVSDGGWYHYPRIVSHVSETLRGQGVERQTLPLLGLGRVCSRRTQRAFGTAMRLCASLLRGVAAPLGCVIFFCFCRNYGFHTLCSGLSACERGGWYHYPRSVPRTAETLDGRLSKRFIFRFLRPGSLH